MRKGASEERSNSSGSLAPLRPVMAPFKVIRTGGSAQECAEHRTFPCRLLPGQGPPFLRN